MSDQYRQLAMEVIVTLSETAPAMIRKFSGKFLNVFGKLACFLSLREIQK